MTSKVEWAHFFEAGLVHVVLMRVLNLLNLFQLTILQNTYLEFNQQIVHKLDRF